MMPEPAGFFVPAVVEFPERAQIARAVVRCLSSRADEVLVDTIHDGQLPADIRASHRILVAALEQQHRAASSRRARRTTLLSVGVGGVSRDLLNFVPHSIHAELAADSQAIAVIHDGASDIWVAPTEEEMACLAVQIGQPPGSFLRSYTGPRR